MAPALGLFFLAPFVGEFLLGNITVDYLLLGLLLAPLYGCGALLVREVGRRGGGWPTMVLLAAAYALIEEGPVDQLLWNDSYAGFDYVHGPTYLPALGTSVELVQTVLALHTVWSICVPIAIVETFVPKRQATPWLGRTGLTVTAVLYALGAAFLFWGNYSEEQFIASPAQLAGIGVVIVALVALAFSPWVRRRPGADERRPDIDKGPPSPWAVGVVGLAGTSLYWAPLVLGVPAWYAWIGVAVWTSVAALGIVLVSHWSRRSGWDQRHRFALAAGATLTYVWTAFPIRPEVGGSLTIDLISNALFGSVAIVLLAIAAHRLTRAPRTSGTVDELTGQLPHGARSRPDPPAK
jgi:hypothetical protein